MKYNRQVKDMYLRKSLKSCPRVAGEHYTNPNFENKFSKSDSYITFIHESYYFYVRNNILYEEVSISSDFPVEYWEYK